MSEEKKARTLTDLLHEHHVDDVLEGETIEEIRLDEIKPNPFQPRRIFDEEKIDELAQSIKEHGVFQPIILKKVKTGYIIVSGERRYRAALKVGLSTIPSIIRQYEEAKVAEIALAENLQRENLTPIEEAEAYKIIMKSLKLTQVELAKKVGKSRSHVTNTLGLLNLPIEVQEMLLTNQISMGHARSLSKLEDQKQIIKLAHRIVSHQLSVRQIEELAKVEVKTNKIKRNTVAKYSKDEKRLSDKLGLKVKIDDKKIVIYLKDATPQEIVESMMKK
ncbi:MAG TPA: ParB/RepB/Spo0J family partition protein [Acholeplasmataceae bacterium]|jgi:ParB family chromosome partitioning protein|nr:ParB/RepB/Spo0J family partition protein [Acholeplasmataceae bacterium]HRX44528.1 ParB/RepB/Spo0J family partition protein [Acholeplasmataceae bacterium]